jgi:hypothetical protein
MLDGCVSLRVSERMPTVYACLAVGCDVSLMILHVWLGVYVALCVLSVVLAGGCSGCSTALGWSCTNPVVFNACCQQLDLAVRLAVWHGKAMCS